MKNLILFDFDGTITTKDSLGEFLFFSNGFLKFYFGALCLSPILFAHKMGFISSDYSKQIVLKYFFKGKSIQWMEAMGNKFCEIRLPAILKKDALLSIKKHINDGDDVCIVTASLSFWVKPWADSLNLNVISTKMEVKLNLLTGKYNGYNCNSYEKVNQIKREYDIKAYKNIIAYGDSKGDLPMLELAHISNYRSFNEK